jgi:hypothetical protein
VLRTNTVTFPFHSHLDLRSERLHVRTTRLALGFVPVGRMDVEVHVRDIGSARVGTAVYPARLLAAAVALAAALAVAPGAPRILLTALAVGLLLLGIVKVLRIERAVGPRLTVPVCWFQRRVAEAVARQVERASHAARGEP